VVGLLLDDCVGHRPAREKQPDHDALGLRPAAPPLPGYIDPGGENYRFGTTESQKTEIGA